MAHILRRGFHLAGSGLALAGVVFVLMRLQSYGSEINRELFDWSMCSAIVLLSMIYGGSNLMLALAWRTLLQHLGTSVSAYWAIRTYGLSQIARYVPGNVFHLAGRQALGAASGIPQWPLVKSALWELCLIALSGFIFVLLVVAQFSDHISTTSGLLLFFTVQIITAALLKIWFNIQITIAFAWLGAFLLISGLIFLVISDLLTTQESANLETWSFLIGAFVFSWLIGFLTPGAPAGFGVRELTLLLLLDGVLGEPELSIAVLAGRIVTATGDALYFLSAVLMKLLPNR